LTPVQQAAYHHGSRGRQDGRRRNSCGSPQANG
jgi:hypothetical protein